MLSAKRLDTTLTKPVTLEYLLYEPDAPEPLPLVLFLHGSGERGSHLDDVKREGIPRLLAEGRDFPFAVVAPQCPDGVRWIDLLGDLGALLDEVMATGAVDPDRVYLIGMSMGAQGAWNLAAVAKERFAALVCVCGFTAPWRARDLVGLPIWAFHGEEDPLVPISESERMVAWLEREGATVTFTRLPGVGHDAWTPVFDMPELYAWLLEQRREGGS